MLTIKDCLPIGVFTRTHGVQGDLVLRLLALDAEDLPEMEWVFVEIDGLPVPFFVREIRSLSADKMILSLETLTNESRAREMTGCRLLIPAGKKIEKAINETGLPDIKDYIVIDTKYGELGKAVEIIDVAGNPLLRIISGKKEILVPVHPDIILDVSEKKKIIRIEAPEGLIDL